LITARGDVKDSFAGAEKLRVGFSGGRTGWRDEACATPAGKKKERANRVKAKRRRTPSSVTDATSDVVASRFPSRSSLRVSLREKETRCDPRDGLSSV
jgi:hypothetical protein